MKKEKILLPLLLILLLTGCASAPQTTTDGQKWQENWIKIGTTLGVAPPDQLTLLENKEALAADGLYYATWVAGSSVPYKNSDGDTIDLYDAQLYLLTNESTDEENAKVSCDTWLSAAKKNYEVQAEDTITLNGQSYTLITYICTGEDTPYAHGVSAFGVCGTTAVCAEFTCLENYAGDLEALLTQFLNNCHFKAD
ncbi:MAG: hypothetical protein PUB28_08150 [Roseburia sp.]|nr:hypothetical protein [Roseburia sp.]